MSSSKPTPKTTPAATLNSSHMTFEEKLAAFDELERADNAPAPAQPTPPPIDDDVVIDPAQDNSTVHTMQQLLLKHENPQLHRVEDPELRRVLDEIEHLAHSNIADVLESRVVKQYIGLDDNDEEVWAETNRIQVRDIDRLPREVTAAIQSIKVTQGKFGDIVEVKMYDKQISLEKLMKFHGAYARDHEQQANAAAGIMDLLLTSIGSNGLPTIDDNSA